MDLTVDDVRAQAYMVWVRKEFECTGECPEVFEAFIESPTWACSGNPNLSRLGSWVGHIFPGGHPQHTPIADPIDKHTNSRDCPGTLFIVWASHWLLGFVRQYFNALKQHGQFRSTACFRVLWLPERWPLEAIAKAVFPFFAIALELLAHTEGYRNLMCGRGTPREGHLNGDCVNNWQHVHMYPGFIISGLVDLISLKIEPPQGTTQVFLALSFLNETILFSLHKKHTPMDILVHQLLTYSGLACALFPAMEAVWVNNPLLTAGRIAATYLHGFWFVAAAHIMFEAHSPVAWDLSDSKDGNQKTDIAPVLYTSILFFNLIMVAVLGITIVLLLVGLAFYRPLLFRSKVEEGPCKKQQEQDSCVTATSEGHWSLE